LRWDAEPVSCLDFRCTYATSCVHLHENVADKGGYEREGDDEEHGLVAFCGVVSQGFGWWISFLST
jgi:hypothetical protein